MEQRLGLDIGRCETRDLCYIVLGQTCLRADPALIGEFDQPCGAPELPLPAATEESAPVPPSTPRQPTRLTRRLHQLEAQLVQRARRLIKDDHAI